MYCVSFVLLFHRPGLFHFFFNANFPIKGKLHFCNFSSFLNSQARYLDFQNLFRFSMTRLSPLLLHHCSQWTGKPNMNINRLGEMDVCPPHCESREGLWLQVEAALQMQRSRDAEPPTVIPQNTKTNHVMSPNQLRPGIIISLTTTGTLFGKAEGVEW